MAWLDVPSMEELGGLQRSLAYLQMKQEEVVSDEKIERFLMQHDTYPGRQGPNQLVLLSGEEEGDKASSAYPGVWSRAQMHSISGRSLIIRLLIKLLAPKHSLFLRATKILSVRQTVYRSHIIF